MQRVILGAGCFWGVQHYFDQVPGVAKTTVGYSGGHTERPRYEDVCTGKTGHAEVVEIAFNADAVLTAASSSSPCQIDMQQKQAEALLVLLKHFFYMHDPTQRNRQGPDIGEQYRSVIFYADQQQKDIAESVLQEQQRHCRSPIVTELAKAGAFYPAEAYHQKFTEKTGRGSCHVAYQPQ